MIPFIFGKSDIHIFSVAFLLSSNEMAKLYIQRGIIVIVSLSILTILFPNSQQYRYPVLSSRFSFALPTAISGFACQRHDRFKFNGCGRLGWPARILIIHETSILPRVDSSFQRRSASVKLWDAGWSTFVSNAFPLGAGIC